MYTCAAASWLHVRLEKRSEMRRVREHTNLSVEERFSRQRYLRCLQHTAREWELDFWLCCVMGATSCHSAALNWVMVQSQLESVMRLVKRMRRQSSALDVRCAQCDNDIGMAPEKI